MNTTPTLTTRFARNTHVIRSETPLDDEQMRTAAPSIFAPGKHPSRSARYTYIPTIEVLRGLKKEGFEPFMVAQGKSRIEGKTEYTKHMIRMRHAGQVHTRPEANENHPDQQMLWVVTPKDPAQRAFGEAELSCELEPCSANSG